MNSVVLVSLLPALAWSASEFSLLQFDPEGTNRQKNTDQVALEIQNEVRTHTVDGITFELNHGPNIQSSNLAATILLQEFELLGGNSNPDQQEIYFIAESFNISSLEDYDEMYNALSEVIEEPLSRDISDDAFAEDRLTMKGTRLRAVTDPSVDLRLNYGQLMKICGKPSVTALTRTKRLFMEDLSFVGQYNDLKSPSKYIPSAIGYFCVNKANKFVPLAIHLIENDLIYSPFDKAYDWILAKMALNAASINVQQMDHFIQSHIMLEPIRVELLRHVHPRHPIFNLLEHHFTQIFANTQAGLQTLLSANTTYDKIFGWGATGSLRFLQEKVERTSFRGFEHRMEQDGLNYLPVYKFRDDGRKVWNALKTFLRSYLEPYYVLDPESCANRNNVLFKRSSSTESKSDSESSSDDRNGRTGGNGRYGRIGRYGRNRGYRKSFNEKQCNLPVTQDTELQGWASASCSFVKDFPCHFTNLDDVVETLTNIIFRICVQHHAWNSDATWHSFSYPYSIPSLNYPLPTAKGLPINLMNYVLPRQVLGESIVAFSAFLRPMDKSRNLSILTSYDSVDLGMLADQAVADYQAELANIEAEIDAREEGAQRPFPLLKPSRLPHYVWI